MKKYRAVLFDLFGTVALFNGEKLPLFEWNGQTSRSTLGGLRAVYEQKVPTVPFASFFTALTDQNGRPRAAIVRSWEKRVPERSGSFLPPIGSRSRWSVPAYPILLLPAALPKNCLWRIWRFSPAPLKFPLLTLAC